jgi:hypothetical protein
MVEPVVSMTVSLIVFLALFFANFIVSWMAVVLVMSGPLKDVQGRAAKSDIDKAGQEAMTGRADAMGASISTAQNPGRRWISLI